MIGFYNSEKKGLIKAIPYTVLIVPLLPFIRNYFALDYTQAGLVISAFTLSYGVGQLPAGLPTVLDPVFWLLVEVFFLLNLWKPALIIRRNTISGKPFSSSL